MALSQAKIQDRRPAVCLEAPTSTGKYYYRVS